MHANQFGRICFVLVQLLFAAIFIYSLHSTASWNRNLPRSSPGHSIALQYTSPANHSFEHVRPTLVVGVFITNSTPSARINAFRRSFSIAAPFLPFTIHHVFVLGESALLAEESRSDILRLRIHENMDEGKTFQFFREAVEFFTRFNIPYHPLNGIVKMDTDTAVDWLAFAHRVFPRLRPMYYLGRRNSRELCGNLPHCPPSHCRDFTSDCWIYMSGGWYALSFDLARSAILNCTFAESHTVGYEDMLVGMWIAHCAVNPTVSVVENGDFFCHSSYILDRHVREMQFPIRHGPFSSTVSCLGKNGIVK